MVSSQPARLTSYKTFNRTATMWFVHFYNVLAPVAGTTPAMTIEVPVQSGANVGALNDRFPTALAIRVTNDIDGASTTEPADGEVVVNISYRSL